MTHTPSPQRRGTPVRPAPTPEELVRWDRQHVWHGFTQMAEYEPLIFQRGDGCVLTDIAGNQYIDAISSLWCNVHGHRHPRLDDAIRQQLDQVAHVTALGSSNPASIELARRLVEITPDGLQHVFFSDDGSTAVEAALKMALQFWQQCENPQPQRNKYIALDMAYHGDTVGGVSLGGMARFHQVFGPLLFEPVRAPAPDTYRMPAGISAETACDYYLGQIEQRLEENAGTVAAVVMEPLVQGAAGMIVHPRGFLGGVRELTRKHDVLLIADEVAVGFGRTGRMFACEHEEVQPDLLCVGKGLSGGYLPVAATLATTQVWSAFLGTHAESKTFFHGHTYGGNPLGAAVSLASLDIFNEEQTIENLPPKIALLESLLEDVAQLPQVGDVRQRGLMAGVELVKDKRTKAPYPWEEAHGALVCQAATRLGVLLRPLGNVVVLMPPLTISLDELARVGEALVAAIQAA
jgi:adenosylmethionine-8-amino-7-oxononanoate aminotransferase